MSQEKGTVLLTSAVELAAAFVAAALALMFCLSMWQSRGAWTHKTSEATGWLLTTTVSSLMLANAYILAVKDSPLRPLIHTLAIFNCAMLVISLLCMIFIVLFLDASNDETAKTRYTLNMAMIGSWFAVVGIADLQYMKPNQMSIYSVLVALVFFLGICLWRQILLRYGTPRWVTKLEKRWTSR